MFDLALTAAYVAIQAFMRRPAFGAPQPCTAFAEPASLMCRGAAVGEVLASCPVTDFVDVAARSHGHAESALAYRHERGLTSVSGH